MNVMHERARAVNDRWPAAQLPQPWHGYGLLGQIVFFVLTVAGIFAFSMLTKNELLTTVMCLALAEFLIRGRRWFGTGVEAALWIAGMISAVMALPNTGAPEGNLLIAAAAALAGLRVRNPVFGAFAAFFVTRYFEVKYDLGALVAVVIAAIALIALHRTWKRPSTEWLFIALLVTMPFAGWDHAGPDWANLSLALSATLTITTFASAIRKRHHGMFGGAAAAAIVTAGMLYERLRISEELLFAAGGSILLVASLLTARLLRGRTHGFVVTRAALTPFDDDLEGLATIAVAPAHSAGNPPEGRSQEGGGFGGAGATGDY